MEKVRFPLKYNSLIISVMVITLVVLTVPVVIYFPSLFSAFFILVIALALWCFVSFSYLVGDSSLLFGGGLFRWRIKYKDIKSIQPSGKSNLKIKYGHSSVIISVKDSQKFIGSIKSKYPGAQ